MKVVFITCCFIYLWKIIQVPINFGSTAEAGCPDRVPRLRLLYCRQPLREGEKARCARCGALPYTRKAEQHRTQRYAGRALILFALANVYPLLDFQFQGRATGSVLSGVRVYAQGMWELAAVVFRRQHPGAAAKALALLYVHAAAAFSAASPGGWRRCFAGSKPLHPWAMTEVYLLGQCWWHSSSVRYRHHRAGRGAVFPLRLIMVMAATDAALEPEAIWERLEPRR